jgi:PhnB protein
MSKSVPPIPPGQGNLIPHLLCDHCSEAIEFYKKAFGAEEFSRTPSPDGSRIMHAALRIGSSVLFLNDDFPEYCGGKSQTPTGLKGTPVSIHRYVEDCDAAIKRAQEAGATVMMPAQDMFWGDRYGVVVDPYGHKWAFATHIKDLKPEEIQAGMKAMFAKGKGA